MKIIYALTIVSFVLMFCKPAASQELHSIYNPEQPKQNRYLFLDNDRNGLLFQSNSGGLSAFRVKPNDELVPLMDISGGLTRVIGSSSDHRLAIVSTKAAGNSDYTVHLVPTQGKPWRLEGVGARRRIADVLPDGRFLLVTNNSAGTMLSVYTHLGKIVGERQIERRSLKLAEDPAEAGFSLLRDGSGILDCSSSDLKGTKGRTQINIYPISMSSSSARYTEVPARASQCHGVSPSVIYVRSGKQLWVAAVGAAAIPVDMGNQDVVSLTWTANGETVLAHVADDFSAESVINANANLLSQQVRRRGALPTPMEEMLAVLKKATDGSKALQIESSDVDAFTHYGSDGRRFTALPEHGLIFAHAGNSGEVTWYPWSYDVAYSPDMKWVLTVANGAARIRPVASLSQPEILSRLSK